MAKKGMRRPDPSEPHGTESNKKNKHPKNDMPPVPDVYSNLIINGSAIEKLTSLL